MSNQGEEEKDTLLGADSDFGCESFEHQSAQTSLYTRLSVCKTLLTFLFLTATFSFIAVLVLLSKYYVLANDHALLETEYTTLETQIVSLKNHIHIESSPYGEYTCKNVGLLSESVQLASSEKSRLLTTKRPTITTLSIKIKLMCSGTPLISTPGSSRSPIILWNRRVCLSLSASPGILPKESISSMAITTFIVW